MDKWADYAIVAVQYDNRSRIVKVKRRTDTGDKLTDETEETRAEVVANMSRRVTYVTVYGGDDGWQRGEDVRAVKWKGNYFIRIDDNEIGLDHLGKLPRF